MTLQNFWDTFVRGEIYMVHGELVELVGYLDSTGEAVFKDERGQRVVCGRGLIRIVHN
ncbi:hypothetical protein [Streptomyces sp. NPDC005907]|uniref:hypothetical protein n=1 Tax=Streptomyces sp. NPDC005907 TaxID=3154571 RepID=UPI0033D8C9CE